MTDFGGKRFGGGYGAGGSSSKGGRRSFDGNSGGGSYGGNRSGGGAERPKTRRLPELLKGVLKWFNIEKGFGFIARDDGNPDVFVHLTGFSESVRNADPRKMKSILREGRTVTFYLEVATRYMAGEYKDRTSAIEVQFTDEAKGESQEESNGFEEIDIIE